MIDYSMLVTALLMGIGSSVHCLGMCGGFAVAIGATKNHGFVWAYNAGRLSIYMLLGALGGALLSGVSGWAIVGLRIVSGLLLVAAGLYIGRWWLGLGYLEKYLAKTWQLVQTNVRRVLPPASVKQAYTLGLLWGAMPCGLIYSSVLWASASGSASAGSLLMLAFGVGTLPAMLGAGVMGTSILGMLRSRAYKILLALLLISAGIWVVFTALLLGESVAEFGYLCSPSSLLHN